MLCYLSLRPHPPQVISVLKKEAVKTQNKEYDKAGDYRQMLVQVGSQCWLVRDRRFGCRHLNILVCIRTRAHHLPA